MADTKCDRCGSPPDICPCLVSREAWFGDELPRTTIPGWGTVEVYKDEAELRVRMVLEFPEVGGSHADRDRVWAVATDWRNAIRARAGTKHDFALSTYNALRNAGLDMDYGYGGQAKYRNEAIQKLGVEAVAAGESWEAPGLFVERLSEELRLWFPHAGESERAVQLVLSRTRAGKPVPWIDTNGDEQPVNKDRVRNRLSKAGEWMSAPHFEPIEPGAAEETWRVRDASVMGVYFTRLGWSAEQLPPGRATAKDEGSEQ